MTVLGLLSLPQPSPKNSCTWWFESRKASDANDANMVCKTFCFHHRRGMKRQVHTARHVTRQRCETQVNLPRKPLLLTTGRIVRTRFRRGCAKEPHQLGVYAGNSSSFKDYPPPFLHIHLDFQAPISNISTSSRMISLHDDRESGATLIVMSLVECPAPPPAEPFPPKHLLAKKRTRAGGPHHWLPGLCCPLRCRRWGGLATGCWGSATISEGAFALCEHGRLGKIELRTANALDPHSPQTQPEGYLPRKILTTFLNLPPPHEIYYILLSLGSCRECRFSALGGGVLTSVVASHATVHRLSQGRREA